jgi:hypothetical protein
MSTRPNKPARPRNIAADIVDAVETATRKWTRQKKSEERHPGMIRYRTSRMTKMARVTQKDAAWEVMEECYRAVSGTRNLPAKVRQIFYRARPKIMAATNDRELGYNYFSQTLLPDYTEEHGCYNWNVVWDARGHFEEPHTNRRIGCGTLEVRNYLHAIKEPSVNSADFSDADVDIIGPSGGYGGVMYCEKEGFDPLFKAVDLANRYDLMIISNKGLSVTAARGLIDVVCGNKLPLFVLTDFDFDGFKNLGTVWRDSRRYTFSNTIEVIHLGLRLEDIAGLEREPAAATKMSEEARREALEGYGATAEEIAILLHERVELNALTSEALVEMIERKLKAYGLKKVIPDDDVLAEAYRAFHRSQELREEFEEMESEFEETEVKVPKTLNKQVRAVLEKHPDLRWDDAIQIVLDDTQLGHVRAEKQKAAKKSGDFTDADEDDQEEDED